jgi:hypothetical protein
MPFGLSQERRRPEYVQMIAGLQGVYEEPLWLWKFAAPALIIYRQLLISAVVIDPSR